jgi:hypothetical protein
VGRKSGRDFGHRKSNGSRQDAGKKKLLVGLVKYFITRGAINVYVYEQCSTRREILRRIGSVAFLARRRHSVRTPFNHIHRSTNDISLYCFNWLPR